MEEKQFYNSADIMKMFQCGKSKAFSIIRSIKSVSDIVGLSGKVTKTDYLAWYNSPLEDSSNEYCNRQNGTGKEQTGRKYTIYIEKKF